MLSMSFTCPLCSSVSWHPRDRAERFCTRCGYVGHEVARRCVAAGWSPGFPSQAVEVRTVLDQPVFAAVTAEPPPAGVVVPIVVPFRMALWCAAWRVVLAPRAMRMLLDLPLAHLEARERPRVPACSSWVPRGMAHGWVQGGGPPAAIDVPLEAGEVKALRAAAVWQGEEIGLQIRADERPAIVLPVEAVRRLDDLLVCNNEARIAA